jgi:hypothetical protein
MASSGVTRRPLPALVALVALLVLAGLVWWRVLHRGSGQAQAGPAPSCSTSRSPAPSSSPALPAPEAVRIVVLNSTNRPGIAGEAQAALVKEGFRSPRPAANDVAHHNRIRAVAQIRYGPRTEPAAKLLHYYLPGSVLRRTHGTRAVVTISLGKRYHRVASPGQVHAAMRADGIGETPAPSTSRARSNGC